MKPIDYEKLYRIPRSTIEDMVTQELNGVTISVYEDGNIFPVDEIHREATKEETELLIRIAVGALTCARYVKDIQHCTDTAEWIIDEFIDDCNGYLTIYSPIKQVWNRMVKLTEGMED